jgi:hypothetical protein
MKIARIVSLSLLMVCGFSLPALATPSTQIWIPSTDIQAYGVIHPGIDTYIKSEKSPNGREATLTDLGPTLGILPFDAIQAEVGFDYRYMGSPAADDSPIYLNAKVGIPEDKLAKFFPAVAVGVYDIGFATNVTNNDLVYGLIAKTLPIIGRVSVGYFTGNPNSAALMDKNGKASNSGLLASIDRSMTELSDKLWLAIDYQGSNSSYGALSFGGSWKFAPNVSVLVGYDLYSLDPANVKPTVTFQLDIDTDIFAPKTAAAPAPAQAQAAPAPAPAPSTAPTPAAPIK